MNEDMLEIAGEDIADIEEEFPEEISVVREMLAEIDEQRPEEPAA